MIKVACMLSEHDSDFRVSRPVCPVGVTTSLALWKHEVYYSTVHDIQGVASSDLKNFGSGSKAMITHFLNVRHPMNSTFRPVCEIKNC